MEKGIKILEEFINNDFQKDKLERNEKGGFKIGTIYKTTELNPALENLIKGYRELDNEHENLLIDVYALFIPKSKIKEKIEEINSELEKKYSAEKISVFSGNTYMEKFKLLGKLQALQELMEDK